MMTGTLVYIPRFWSRNEFAALTTQVPRDFAACETEFWDYVQEKLASVISNVNYIFHEGCCKGGLNELKEYEVFSKRNMEIVEALMEKATLEVTEDKLLMEECNSWLEVLQTNPSTVNEELYQEALRARCGFVEERITDTLKHGGMGALVFNPLLKFQLPANLRLIRMCRFEPEDYLVSCLAKLRLHQTSGEKG